mmetsp:Transcript_95005/g.277822  ORF Transcript_95005/g.277822 Transcript_95005/m.277822 type:complete len:84 (+) Transcript_95005:209-460(+)
MTAGMACLAKSCKRFLQTPLQVESGLGSGSAARQSGALFLHTATRRSDGGDGAAGHAGKALEALRGLVTGFIANNNPVRKEVP